MRLGWLALPVLMVVEGCAPVRSYQAAARSLQFRLNRVEPRLQWSLPLDRSRLALRISLEVTNPSDTPFHLRGFQGALSLDSAGQSRPVGQVQLARALELPARGQAELVVEVSFSYQDLREQWPALEAASRPGAAGAWSLDGSLELDAYGLALRLPVRTRHRFGAGA